MHASCPPRLGGALNGGREHGRSGDPFGLGHLRDARSVNGGSQEADSRVGRIPVGRHKITRAPDPVDKIARELGIQIKLDKVDADLSGFIVRDNGKRVLIGAEQAPPSKPAAVLGHYFLHAGRAFG